MARTKPSLRHGAREPVEDEAVPALRLLDGLLDDAHHDVVGHQRARLHGVLRAHTVGQGGTDMTTTTKTTTLLHNMQAFIMF